MIQLLVLTLSISSLSGHPAKTMNPSSEPPCGTLRTVAESLSDARHGSMCADSMSKTECTTASLEVLKKCINGIHVDQVCLEEIHTNLSEVSMDDKECFCGGLVTFSDMLTSVEALLCLREDEGRNGKVAAGMVTVMKTTHQNFLEGYRKMTKGATQTGCDAGWTYFEHTGKCYKSFETRLTRAAAIEACKSSNPTAALVSIPDMTTNDFVLSMVSWRSWIGLEKVNGAWVWPDGSEDTLRNWIPGEPSGDGAYVEIVKDAWRGGKSGQWNDLGLKWGGDINLRGSVCQHDP